MTDIPTQAPRDSAVEPAGVSDALPLWHKHAKPFTQGYAVGYDEFVAAIGEARDAARQQLAELQKERDEWMARAGAALLMVPDDKLCGDLRKARDEIDATRQQLAEMRAERDNNDTRRLMFVTHNYKRMNFWGMADDDIRAAIDAAIAEDAPPSQPSRGKCETWCNTCGNQKLVMGDGAIGYVDCPDCAPPERLMPSGARMSVQAGIEPERQASRLLALEEALREAGPALDAGARRLTARARDFENRRDPRLTYADQDELAVAYAEQADQLRALAALGGVK